MGIAIAIVCLFVLYVKFDKKTTKRIEEQRAKTQKLIEETNKIMYESEYMEMEMFLEQECCLGSLIADYYDVENPTMTKREYYESEMIKHGILDVYNQWKEEVLPTLLED